MNSKDSRARELSPEEIAGALDWIDGELAQDDSIAFELRMSQNSELARQVEALANVDAFMRRDARARAGVSRERRRWVTFAALAAAALIVVALLPKILAPRAAVFEVALAPSFAIAEDWVSQQSGLEGASAPGIAVSRGSNSRPLTAADFLRASEASEAAVVEQALAAGRQQLEAGWFVVPIDLKNPAFVTVLSFTEKSAPLRMFPSSKNTEEAMREGLVAAGRSILPSERAVKGHAPDTLEYRPGFLVPIGAQELTLLVGELEYSGGQRIPSWDEIDGWLASGLSADQVSARLKEQHFIVKRLTVREPK